jgi:hypothetical protein
MSGSDQATAVTPTPSTDCSTSVAKKRTWDACAGLHEVQSPLTKLDSAVVFGDDYPEPIRYDAARKVLRYRGFMSHATYVKLAALSDDRAYQTALERLFVATSPTAEAPAWQMPWRSMAVAAAAAIVLAGGWLAWNRPMPPSAPIAPPANRVVARKVMAADEIAVRAADATTSGPEAEARHPVER